MLAALLNYCFRIGHTSSLVGDKMLTFGGRLGISQESTSLSDLYSLDLHSNSWQKIEAPNGPEPRSYHASTACTTALFIFGGCGANGRLNDLWQFDIASSQWKKLEGGQHPSARGGAALCYHENSIYLFGGSLHCLY